MARKPEIQYVRYYTDGTAARVIQRREQRPPVQAPAPKRKRAAQPVKRVDTIAVFGTLAAVVMLVCMLVGLAQLTETERRISQTAASVQMLQEENERLQMTYHDSYDPEAVRAAALNLGMIPKEQAQHIVIPPASSQTQTLSWWEMLVQQLRQLFA